MRLLLTLDVVMQRALLQRRYVDDGLAVVGGVVANGQPFPGRQRKLNLWNAVGVAEICANLCQSLGLGGAGSRLVKTAEFFGELQRLAACSADVSSAAPSPASSDSPAETDANASAALPGWAGWCTETSD
jgi:hypothetical protein